VKFQRGVIHMAPGDVLVACTDGIFDRRNAAGEFFGEENLSRLVTESPASAPALLDRLFDAALAYGDGRRWEDDATIVVVRRKEAPPAA
jgi:sigma-B regulation protein RsbU (phosphoserine phosphatase)